MPTRLVAGLVLAPSWVVAAALLIKGHETTGDGFSAGLTAGTGVLIHHLVFGRDATWRLGVVRHAPALLWAGLVLALVVVFLPLAAGRPPITHFPPPAQEPLSLGTLQLQSGFAFDLGVALVVFAFATAVLDIVSRFRAEPPEDGP